MELLGRIFGHHGTMEEQVPSRPSEKLLVLVSRWGEQVVSRKPTETTVATAELLQALIRSPELLPWGKLKFVREGNRVVMNLGGIAHKDIARQGGLRGVSDAGEIRKDEKEEERLLVTGDSVSLRIERNNKNRPDTVKVLRKIAPKIKIEQSIW